MIVQSRNGTSWSTAIVDSWVGDPNFVEGTDKIGTLAGDATAGSNKVLQLGVGQAANFTPNRYYYITDMSNHAWVNYCKVTADDTIAHTITVDTIDKNFPTGSVIAAYAHRMYCAGNVLASGIGRMNSVTYTAYSSLPYCSSETSNKAFSSQSGPIYSGVTVGLDTATLAKAAPNDRGYFACQKPFLVEGSNHQASYSDGMTEGYGIMKNIYVTNTGTMVQGLDGKTIGGSNWLYFQPLQTFIYQGPGGLAVLLPDSTSLV
jgi:hypothetical protein